MAAKNQEQEFLSTARRHTEKSAFERDRLERCLILQLT